MKFFITIYILLYTVNLLSLYYLLHITFQSLIYSASLQYIVFYIMNYSKFKHLYYSILLNLIGVPPFIFFFIKFNFLIYLLPKVAFYIFYLVFNILFLHMLFYIQTLYLKNVNITVENIKFIKPKITYKKLYTLVSIQGFSYLSVIFYIDAVITITLAVSPIS
jgi:hypothetical protein